MYTLKYILLQWIWICKSNLRYMSYTKIILSFYDCLTNHKLKLSNCSTFNKNHEVFRTILQRIHKYSRYILWLHFILFQFSKYKLASYSKSSWREIQTKQSRKGSHNPFLMWCRFRVVTKTLFLLTHLSKLTSFGQVREMSAVNINERTTNKN